MITFSGAISRLGEQALVVWRLESMGNASALGSYVSGLLPEYYYRYKLNTVDVNNPSSFRSILLELCLINIIISTIHLIFMILDIYYVIEDNKAKLSLGNRWQLLKESLVNIRNVAWALSYSVMESSCDLFYPSILVLDMDIYTEDNRAVRQSSIKTAYSIVRFILALILIVWEIINPHFFQIKGKPMYTDYMSLINIGWNSLWTFSAISFTIIRNIISILVTLTYHYPNNPFLSLMKTYSFIYYFSIFYSFSRTYCYLIFVQIFSQLGQYNFIIDEINKEDFNIINLLRCIHCRMCCACNMLCCSSSGEAKCCEACSSKCLSVAKDKLKESRKLICSSIKVFSKVKRSDSGGTKNSQDKPDLLVGVSNIKQSKDMLLKVIEELNGSVITSCNGGGSSCECNCTTNCTSGGNCCIIKFLCGKDDCCKDGQKCCENGVTDVCSKDDCCNDGKTCCNGGESCKCCNSASGDTCSGSSGGKCGCCTQSGNSTCCCKDAKKFCLVCCISNITGRFERLKSVNNISMQLCSFTLLLFSSITFAVQAEYLDLHSTLRYIRKKRGSYFIDTVHPVIGLFWWVWHALIMCVINMVIDPFIYTASFLGKVCQFFRRRTNINTNPINQTFRNPSMSNRRPPANT
ncbi:Vesa-like [Babesia microti strain RI]|uniref:Vesa-like n=1 Tax=Babesia microti (strain RI) TaxID=1133968 RepID=A0A1N6LW77_BABMR|nr:Vesa-like [Babesia microti strain RI]SIO73116.1 Vesa-like [Babesia microti strain RI]|eukprot:XP_021337228.1 Vesa-like [Babesia microti strain RI]